MVVGGPLALLCTEWRNRPRAEGEHAAAEEPKDDCSSSDEPGNGNDGNGGGAAVARPPRAPNHEDGEDSDDGSVSD